jgi:voltage-gated potassium channel
MPGTDVYRRLALLGIALFVIILGGTIADSLVEHENFWNAFVWTIDTVATTGSIQAPQDPAGEVVKVALTFLGVGTLFYALVSLTELVVTGELGTLLAERRAQRMTERLRDHFIVCGFGRVGRQVAHDLRAAGAPYVVIDDDEANREAAYAPGVRFIKARPSCARRSRSSRAPPRRRASPSCAARAPTA